MQIQNLTQYSKVYTSNVYFIRGNKNAISDMNTLIDVGNDDIILDLIESIWTGVGNKKVDQVILTHNHFDHTNQIDNIVKKYDPVVYAASRYLKFADVLLKDGSELKIGDETGQIIETPGHTGDSICIFCYEYGSLFVGDTPVIINSNSNEWSFEENFVEGMEKICGLDVNTIFFGHGKPLNANCNLLLGNSLNIIKKFV